MKTTPQQQTLLFLKPGLSAVKLRCLGLSVFKTAQVQLLHPSHGVWGVGAGSTTQTPLPLALQSNPCRHAGSDPGRQGHSRRPVTPGFLPPQPGRFSQAGPRKRAGVRLAERERGTAGRGGVRLAEGFVCCCEPKAASGTRLRGSFVGESSAEGSTGHRCPDGHPTVSGECGFLGRREGGGRGKSARLQP